MRGCIYIKKIYMIVSICMTSILFSNCFMNEAFGGIISNTNDSLSKDSIVLSNDMYAKEVLNVTSEVKEIKEIQQDKEFRKEADYVENEIMFIRSETRKVSFEPEYLNSDNSFCKEYQLSNIEMVSESISSIFNESVEYYVTYKARTNNDVWKTVDSMNEDVSIVCAEPNLIYKTEEVEETEDEGYNIAYTTVPTSENYPNIASQWYLDEFNMTNVWDNLLNNDIKPIVPGNGTTVAVIDTGVRLTHEALKNNIWINKKEIAGNNKDDDGNGYIDDVYGVNVVNTRKMPKDDNGHGTHVAGIIAMHSKNGGVGIAYGSKILPIKASDQKGTFEQGNIVKAINYAIKQNVDVINMSFSGGYSASVEVAVKNAYNNNIILVAAAGNEGAPTSDGVGKVNIKAEIYDNYPAGSKYVLGVMAYDQCRRLAYYSNWDYQTGKGAEYDLIAPGSDIYSTFNKSDSDYKFDTGTSMASPMVAGMAAILRSIYPSKTKYSNAYLMNKLKSNDYITYTDENGLKHKYRKMNTDILPLINNMNKVNLDACKISLSSSFYTYDGKYKKPKVTIKFGKRTLVQGQDYTIEYSKNKSIGQGTVKIKGNSYKKCVGTIYKYFNIVPPKVSGAKIVAYNTKAIKLQWKTNSYASGYEVYRYNASTKKYVLIKRYNSKNSLTYTNTSLASGTTYYYKIRCFKIVNNKRIYSASTSAIKGTTVPSRTVLSYNTYSKSAIKLQWKKVIGASGYYIYRYSSKIKKYQKIKNVNGNTTTYTDTGLKTRTSYYYTIRAYKKFGSKVIYGDYAYKMKAYTGPATPTITSGKVYNHGTVMINWTEVKDTSGYEVWCSFKKDGTYEFGCDLSANYKGVLLSDIPNGTMYYKVRVFNTRDGKKVYSSFSNIISITMY